MATYIEALDALAVHLETQLGIATTRDPATVSALTAQGGGCIYIGMPNHVQRLVTGANLEVPVSLVGLAPSNLQAIDYLLTHMDKFVEVCGAKSVNNGPIDVGDMTFPSITATVQFTVEV